MPRPGIAGRDATLPSKVSPTGNARNPISQSRPIRRRRIDRKRPHRPPSPHGPQPETTRSYTRGKTVVPSPWQATNFGHRSAFGRVEGPQHSAQLRQSGRTRGTVRHPDECQTPSPLIGRNRAVMPSSGRFVLNKCGCSTGRQRFSSLSGPGAFPPRPPGELAGRDLASLRVAHRPTLQATRFR